MMLKNVLRRFFALAMTAVILTAVLPVISVPAMAATTSVDLSGVTVDGLDISCTTDANNKNFYGGSGSGNQITLWVKSESGTCSDTSYKTTLTLTNKKGAAALLSFDYTVTVSSGTIKVANDSVTVNGSYSDEVAAGRSITVTLKSGSTAAATQIVISNLALTVQNNVTTTFVPAEHGSYKVDGQTITAEISKTQDSTTAYNMVATAASGYKFVGWYSQTKNLYVSAAASATLMLEEAQTITAIFTEETTPVFDVGGQQFQDLNEANQYATSSGIKKIVLASNSTLPKGNYTISSGNTLLIPFDDAHTCYTTEPGLVDNGKYKDPTYYRKLTMNSDAKITVESGATFSVSGKLNSPDANSTSGTIGTYGWIYMKNGSEIVVNGMLSCYGFITGDGVITVNASAEVHETFALPEFRGGGGLYAMRNNSNNVFPASQYYIQNIGAPMTLYSGATLTGHTSVYITTTKSSAPQSVLVVGKDDGLFQLKKGTLTKQYVPKEDRCQIDINGEAEISGFSLGMTMFDINYTFDSTNYVLPINGHFNINLLEGTVVTVGSDIELLPGVRLGIAEKAELVIASGKNLYTYDSDQWAKYVYSNKRISPFLYYPDREYKRSDNATDLSDVLIDVNGKITANGGFYTTSSGANIISSKGTGSVTFTNNEVGTSSAIYQASAQSGSGFGTEVTYATIEITSAQLHNADGSYTTTADAVSGDVYHYCSNCDKWYKVGNHHLVNLYVNDSETAVVQCTDSTSVSFENIENPALDETTYDPAEKAAEASYDSDTKTLTVNGLDAETTTVHVYTARAEVVTVNNEGTSSSTAYSTIQKAIDKCTDGSYIRMITDSTEESLALTKNVCLDLAGKTVTLTRAMSGSGKLYGMDSTATDYQNAPKGKLILPGGTVAQTAVMPGSGETYVKIVDGNTYSFHRCNLYINGYRFELNRGKNEGALIFQATLQGDKKVMAAAQKGGFVINNIDVDTDKDKNPVALTADGQFEGYWHTTSVKENLETPISAVAQVYFLLDTADPIESHMISLTFKKAMQNADELTDVDKEKINAFFDTPIFTASPA